jgi:hypothetical protein
MERLLSSVDSTMDVSAQSDPASPRQRAAPGSGSGSGSGSGGKTPSGPKPASPSEGQATVVSASGSERGADARGWKVALAGAVLAGGLGAVALLRDPSAKSATTVPSASTTREAAAPSASPPPPAPVPAPAPEAGASLPSEVAITIDGLPVGTKIFRGVLLLGTIPGTVRVPRGTDKVSIRLVAEGYTPAEIEVVPDVDRSLTVNLARAVARPVKPRTPKDLETF